MTFDEQEFKTWHNQYRPRLLTSMTTLLKNRDTAEDVTATALATAWKHRAQFRGESSLWTWVYRIALNEARSSRRHRGRVWVSIEKCNGQEIVSDSDIVTRTLEQPSDAGNLREQSRKYRLSTGGCYWSTSSTDTP